VLQNRVPALAGVKVTMCDPTWHVIFRGGLLFKNCYIHTFNFDNNNNNNNNDEQKYETLGIFDTTASPAPV